MKDSVDSYLLTFAILFAAFMIANSISNLQESETPSRHEFRHPDADFIYGCWCKCGDDSARSFVGDLEILIYQDALKCRSLKGQTCDQNTSEKFKDCMKGYGRKQDAGVHTE